MGYLVGTVFANCAMIFWAGIDGVRLPCSQSSTIPLHFIAKSAIIWVDVLQFTQ